MNDTNTVNRPNTIGELIELTRSISRDKNYLLIESKDETLILVGIRTAVSFNIGVDLINDQQYNRLSEYFEQYGAGETINIMANTVWNSQRS